ncbi:hypothetical protein JOD82_002043 [Paenibacillus sp. 1182]|uniref:hypothetical protein n=1 Tax=Paenibacillus sp. 1182 TaxID=2806565 RepID=UPI001AE22FC0|nr:hypothetical protein [Paenibacillus sp. 1182]MBP1309023.1 hypothetical protein [Paenibacillus sp. 1182]
MKTHKPSIKKLAKKLSKIAKEKGFVVQRYDATNSVYLKLDYGVANSIRIGDHDGKKHLSYKFNLLTNIDKSYVEHGEYQRSYYCVEDFEKLIDDILNNKNNVLKKYGVHKYQRMMKKNQLENANKDGFWSKAKLV